MTASRGTLPLLTTLVLALLMATPTALSHAAEEPLNVEVEVLEDEGEDAFYWYDGYDLYNLFVREAYWEPLDQEGIIFRFTLYGGFSEAPEVDALHIDISAGSDNATTLRLTTTDDQTWEGDLTVVAANITEDEPPFTGVTSKLQAFVPYDALGLSPGDTLANVSMASYAGEDLRDIAPGGFFLPGSGGQGEVPGESQRLVDELPLEGTGGYTEVTPTATGSSVQLLVKSNLEATGQHIEVVPGQAPGWNLTVEGPTAASVDAGGETTFDLNVTASSSATEPLPVAIITDLGGREWVYLGINGTELQTGLEPASVDVAPEQPPQESPGPGVLGLLLGLTLAVALVGRRC